MGVEGRTVDPRPLAYLSHRDPAHRLVLIRHDPKDHAYDGLIRIPCPLIVFRIHIINPTLAAILMVVFPI
jgi:hypothetical protein